MLLNGYQIIKLIEHSAIEWADIENVNAASLDVRLTDHILLNVYYSGPAIKPKDKGDLQFVRRNLPCTIMPGDFFLACTAEKVNLPDNVSAQVVTKSSAARIGLDHATAGFCDAGFSGQITLEFVNHSKNMILIEPGVKLVQLKFFQHEDAGKYSYRNKGQYNGSVGIETSKGVK